MSVFWSKHCVCDHLKYMCMFSSIVHVHLHVIAVPGRVTVCVGRLCNQGTSSTLFSCVFLLASSFHCFFSAFYCSPQGGKWVLTVKNNVDVLDKLWLELVSEHMYVIVWSMKFCSTLHRCVKGSAHAINFVMQTFGSCHTTWEVIEWALHTLAEMEKISKMTKLSVCSALSGIVVSIIHCYSVFYYTSLLQLCFLLFYNVLVLWCLAQLCV